MKEDARNSEWSILIADGDETSGPALRDELNALGHNAQWVSNGIGALEKVKGFTPDLVIIDLDITEMDALTVCEIMHQEPDLTHTVYIAQGTASDAVKHDLINAGFNCLIKKPVTIDELDKALAIRLKPSTLDVFAHALTESIRF